MPKSKQSFCRLVRIARMFFLLVYLFLQCAVMVDKDFVM